jgi:hypothetical protein
VRVVPRKAALTEIAMDEYEGEGADVFVISADLAQRNEGCACFPTSARAPRRATRPR